jgi:hypothetical protein
MAKKPPKKYKPGELDRTRSRIGPLSKEESERLSNLFGGEVGVEHDDPIVEDRYRRLREKAYRDRIIKDTSVSGNRLKAVVYPQERSSFSFSESDRTYVQRISLWVFAGRSEFSLISRHRVWLAFWPFNSPKELLNPRFIMSGGDIFYRHVEKAVLAVRGLLRRVEKNRVHQLRNSFYRQIAQCLKDWEIEAMHQELTMLQMRPRSVSSREFSKVLFFLYRPLIQLQNLLPQHIEKALRHLYDLSILELPKRSLEADRMKQHYLAAVEEIDYIFGPMPVRCYPLLLLLFSRKPLPYRPFLKEKQKELLKFFQLQDHDILKAQSLPSQTGGLDLIEKQPEGEEPEAAVSEKEPSVRDEDKMGWRQSLLMLERLFPGSGWIHLDDAPDLYPYFDPLFKLPQGSGLLAPGDPLQYVTVLSSVIEELLYGFREADFGVYPDEEGSPLDIKPEYERICDSWHRFPDELLGKYYLEILREFCRNVERSWDFAFSEYGKRVEADLLFFRHRYLFPNMQFSIPKYMQPRKLPQVQKMYPVVNSLKQILLHMVREEGTQALRNPHEPYRFPVPNMVSRRLDSLLSGEGKERNFRNLARYSYAAVMVLDRILQQEETPPSPLYRHVEQREDLPVYSVTSLDTDRLLRNIEGGYSQETVEPLALTGEWDLLTALPGSEMARRDLLPLVSEHPEGSIALLRIRTDGRHIAATAKKIEARLRPFRDRLYRLYGGDFLAILTETGEKHALDQGRALSAALYMKGGRGPAVALSFPQTLPDDEKGPQWDVNSLLGDLENSVPAGELPEHATLFRWNPESREPEEIPL